MNDISKKVYRHYLRPDLSGGELVSSWAENHVCLIVDMFSIVGYEEAKPNIAGYRWLSYPTPNLTRFKSGSIPEILK